MIGPAALYSRRQVVKIQEDASTLKDTQRQRKMRIADSQNDRVTPISLRMVYCCDTL